MRGLFGRRRRQITFEEAYEAARRRTHEMARPLRICDACGEYVDFEKDPGVLVVGEGFFHTEHSPWKPDQEGGR